MGVRQLWLSLGNARAWWGLSKGLRHIQALAPPPPIILAFGLESQHFEVMRLSHCLWVAIPPLHFPRTPHAIFFSHDGH